jgi:hypothetical protein
MNTTELTVKIPASCTNDHAYAYGYLTGSFLMLDCLTHNIDESSLLELQILCRNVKRQVQIARELDADMSRRADERIRELTNV